MYQIYKEYLGRRFVRDAIMEHVMKPPRTNVSLECLSQDEVDNFYETSLRLERRFRSWVNDAVDEERFRMTFQRQVDQNKFCSWDVHKIFSNEEEFWRRFFVDLESNESVPKKTKTKPKKQKKQNQNKKNKKKASSTLA